MSRVATTPLRWRRASPGSRSLEKCSDAEFPRGRGGARRPGQHPFPRRDDAARFRPVQRLPHLRQGAAAARLPPGCGSPTRRAERRHKKFLRSVLTLAIARHIMG